MDRLPSRLRTRLVAVSLGLVSAWGCSPEPESHSASKALAGGADVPATALLNVYASTLAGSSLNAAEPKSCSFRLDIYRGEGVCLTPTGFVGYASNLLVAESAQTDPSKGSARLSGVAGPDAQPGSIFSGAPFDLADSDGSFRGNNELWAQYETRARYDHLSLEMAYQQIQFQLNGKTVTLLLATYDQPFAASEVLTTCGVGSAERDQRRFADADLLPGMIFRRGDYLFCVRDDPAIPCGAADYQWLDLATSTLVATRPARPKVNAWVVAQPPNCSGEGERIDVGMAGLPLAASLAQPFQLWADFSHGVNSQQWPEARAALGRELSEEEQLSDFFETPYAIYTHRDAAGSATTGTVMTLDVNFDVSEMLFLAGVQDPDELAALPLGEALAKLWPKHDWVFEHKAQHQVVGYSASQVASLGATVAVALSGGGGTDPDGE